MPEPAKPRRRYAAVAALLCLLNPGHAMLYLGRPVRALLYFSLSLLVPLLAIVLAAAGLWPAGISWLVAYYALIVVAAAEAVRIARQVSSDFVGSWYTRWYGLLLIFAVLAAAVSTLRVEFYEPFRQPSASMMPTLREGDLFFVSKRSYESRLPQRGDIVVFRLPTDPNVMYVKRVVGLPGDVVEYDGRTKRLSINGVVVPAEELEADPDIPGAQRVRGVLDGRAHLRVWMRSLTNQGGTYTVPDGHYFVIGDHRDNSMDSRFLNVGFVPFENIVGKLVLIWWNTDMPERAGTVPD
jgi:signal peptidase I